MFMFGVSLPLLNLIILAVSSASTNPTDGFNIYKDFLRNKVEESDLPMEAEESPRMYFYRAPSVLVYGLSPDSEAFVGKRTSNHFKNHMLNGGRDVQEETAENRSSDTGADLYHFPRVLVKRDLGRKSDMSDTTGYLSLLFDDTPSDNLIKGIDWNYPQSNLNRPHYPTMTAIQKRGPGSILNWALSYKNPLKGMDSNFFSDNGRQLARSATHKPFVATMGKRSIRDISSDRNM